MVRKAKEVVLNEEEKAELEARVRSRTIRAQDRQRAGIILGCALKKAIARIALENGSSQTTVMRWKGRFLASRLEGLEDEVRSGRPVCYGAAFKSAVLGKLSEPPPAGYGQWDGALLAQELGASKDAVWRLLRAQRISLARKRTWCVSTDPEFVAKAADVAGLYLNPPEKALVISVDEKPNIQALSRRTGYAVSSDKKWVRALQSTYKRNGTLNLFAALEVATGRIHEQVTAPAEKTKKGFLCFMDALLAELPDAEGYHVIMDNHSIHKHHAPWLAGHPNVHFHYTPTSASWLNRVEIWFGILSLKSLRGCSFASTTGLKDHIEQFVAHYNQHPKPFVWRKRSIRGTQLSNDIRNFCN
jgi:transposase